MKLKFGGDVCGKQFIRRTEERYNRAKMEDRVGWTATAMS